MKNKNKKQKVKFKNVETRHALSKPQTIKNPQTIKKTQNRKRKTKRTENKKTFRNMKQIYLILFLAFASIQINAQSNQYLHLDGNDDSVILEDASQYLVGADGFTMAGWFYTDELVYGQGMLDFRGASEDEFYVIMLADGILECRWIPNGTTYEIVTPAFTILPEKWQHIAFTFTGNSIVLYVDGVVVDTAPAAGAFDDPTVDFSIGESVITCCDFYFGGGVDEVTLWSKSLTQPEVQDMMDNELTGEEEGLEVYYKFNQGVPEEDNSSIAEAVSEVGGSDRNGTLSNLALTGTTSNFIGDLDLGFQAITFPIVPNVLISGEPFTLGAEASSSLDVSYSIVSGPATLDGNMVTLTGEEGEVVIVASQGGDGTFEAANDVTQSFQVLDPQTTVPTVELRNPLAGVVSVPDLSAIQLAAIAGIDYPELFNVKEVLFQVGNETITATDWGNGHYTAWWVPPAHGVYTVDVIAKNNYDAERVESAEINIVDSSTDQEAMAIEGMVLDGSVSVGVVEAELPSFLGAYDQILATLDIKCPAGGCDPWDRVAHIEAKGHNGEWIEIIRYITPYGIACDHTIDLTDFASMLQGKITFRVNYVTFAGGFDYNLRLDYRAGTPEYKYSQVQELWEATYDFGDFANLQPVPTLNIAHPENAETSKIKLVSTGHGWYGDGTQNNTGNAAEFYEATHNVWVNGEETYEQHNWLNCNPNPDACNNQLGTWTFNRAGWCPGAIAPWFDYDMTPYISENTVELNYRFFDGYVDLCHPNHPDCETNTPPQCDCSAGFNPHLIVASSLISFSNQPLEEVFNPVNPGDTTVTDTMTAIQHLNVTNAFDIYPNPSEGLTSLIVKESFEALEIKVLNSQGSTVWESRSENTIPGQLIELNLKELPKGIYMINIVSDRGQGVERLVLE